MSATTKIKSTVAVKRAARERERKHVFLKLGEGLRNVQLVDLCNLSKWFAAKLLERGAELLITVGNNRSIDHGPLLALLIEEGAVGFWGLRFELYD